MLLHRTLRITLLILAAGAGAGSLAEEITLKAVSAFADGTTFSKNFQRFADKVNETGKSKLQINYLGGGEKVMNPFELGKSIQTGVVDLGNLPGAFYTNLVPEADAIKLSVHTIQEERQNGAWEYLNKLHNDKMNAQHIARQKDCVPFHIYLTKKIDKPDLHGLKLRVSPIYRAFFDALGATSVQMKPGDVYTALERGAVDGYGWPIQGVFDLGWQEATKYRIDPGFYRSAVEVLLNLDVWKKLDADQRKILMDAATWLEGLCAEDEQLNAAERERQAQAGIQTIEFSGGDGAAYLNKAYDAGWAAFIKQNPEHGPKLKELLSQ
ncbi:MAG: TRAP transporter substrate-binding protein DctP [Gammaproteobacteria bacterium]